MRILVIIQIDLVSLEVPVRVSIADAPSEEEIDEWVSLGEVIFGWKRREKREND